MPLSGEEPDIDARARAQRLRRIVYSKDPAEPAAAPLGSGPSLLPGHAAWMLLHLYESANMLPFQYS